MSLASELLPPLAFRSIRSARRALFPPPLFNGDSGLFRRVVGSCRVYGEYGVGASTDWVFANTAARIIAAETSHEWAAKVQKGKDPARVTGKLFDLGPVGRWGRPLGYSRRDAFRGYQESIWQGPTKPDVVLIDGRFRVCCFLTSVLRGGPGLRILFDDYDSRPRYHIVEEVVPLLERCGRQALFEVPAGFAADSVAALRDRFEYVMD